MKRMLAVCLIALVMLTLTYVSLRGTLTGMFLAEGYKDINSRLSLNGYVPIKVEVNGNTVRIKYGCYAIDKNVLDGQALSIYHVINNITYFRPLTHDLIKDMLDLFEIKVKVAKIVDYRDGVYYARLVLERGNKIVDLDARPSDVIAIALRYNKSVYIKESIIKENGMYIC